MYNIVLTVIKTYKVIKNVDFLRALGCWDMDTTCLNWDSPIYGNIKKLHFFMFLWGELSVHFLPRHTTVTEFS